MASDGQVAGLAPGNPRGRGGWRRALDPSPGRAWRKKTLFDPTVAELVDELLDNRRYGNYPEKEQRA